MSESKEDITLHKIGFLQFGAMADVLYATPILRYVRKTYPNSHITWCIRDKFAEVVETNPFLDAVKVYCLPDGYASRQEAEHVMWQRMKKDAERGFDLVIKPQQWPDHNFWRSGKDLVSLMAENAGLDPSQITDRRIVLGVTAEDSETAREFAKEKLGKNRNKLFVTVNHISYAASPVWSPESYSELVDLLDQNHDVMCFFTGAPNEPIPEHCIDARGLPYRVWAALIAQSNLWLGLDSGAVALACASDTPIIKLHSPDFPLAKTGIKAMGLRQENVLELCPAPNPEAMAGLIVENMK